MTDGDVEKRSPPGFHYVEVNTEKELRCPDCNRLLLKGDIKSIETKCTKCKATLRFAAMN